MPSVSTTETMAAIIGILGLYSTASEAVLQEAGPLSDGELLSLSMNTLSSILEVANAWATTRPEIHRKPA